MTREKGLHPVAGVCCSICVAQPRVNPEGARCRDARLSVFQRVSQRNEVCDDRLERGNVGPGSRKAANLEWRIVAWKTVRIRHREAEHEVHSYVVDCEPAIRSTSDGLHAEANLGRAPELPDQARRDARGAGSMRTPLMYQTSLVHTSAGRPIRCVVPSTDPAGPVSIVRNS